MPKNRCRGIRITFFKTRKYLGSNKYASGDIPGKQLTFNTASNDSDLFEELMEVHSAVFNDIQNATVWKSIKFAFTKDSLFVAGKFKMCECLI